MLPPAPTRFSYYEHLETGRCFTSVVDIGATFEGYDTLRRLADTSEHIVPGHDPLVMTRYPAVSKALEGIAVRLDVMPVTSKPASPTGVVGR